MSDTENDLARRAVQGDHDAFAEIIHCHQLAVFNVAYRLHGNAQDAEDATQETFIRAYRFLAGFDPQRPILPWLKRIAVNVCLQRLEKMPYEQILDEETVISIDLAVGPERQVEYHSLQDRIRLELMRLPPRFRAAIELRHYQNLSYEEIAATLDRSLSDIKSDLFRARKLLAERLKDLETTR
jgi:RNA polymerase sigma-70 factor, ECF subfamily